MDDHRIAQEHNGSAVGLSPSMVPRPPTGVVSADAFRGFMAGFPTGVAVVTALDSRGEPAGMTCSSLCSVSIEPPMLLVCLRRGSPTLRAVLHSRVFTVNLLHAGARSTAELFASGAPDRFARVRWTLGAGTGGPRLTEDSHAVADCRVGTVVPAGDHTVVFGEAHEIIGTRDAAWSPLLHGLRRYGSWPNMGPDELAPPLTMPAS